MEMNKGHHLIVGKFPDTWEIVNTMELLVDRKDAMKIGPFGSRLKKELLTMSGYKVYGQENVSENDYTIGWRYVDEDKFQELKSCEIIPGDLLITMMGSIGFVGIVPENIEKGIMDSHLLRLRVNDNICDKKYLIYALRSGYVQQQIENLSVGIIMAGLSSTIIKKLSFLKPALEYQKQIAKVLCDLDAKIEVNNKINQELEALAKSIYDYWFVQFDFPDENGKPYKASGGKMVYNEALKREIPEGWTSFQLGDIGRVSMCKRVMKHETSEHEEIPFYKISTFGNSPETFISKKLFESYREKYPYPKKGDILISAAGTIGKTVIFDGQPSYFQDSNIVWLDNDESKISNGFLYYYYQKEPWIVTGGSTIKRLYNNNIRSLKICRPDSKLLDKFTKLVDFTLKKQEYIKKENKKLLALRDWLLPMLMNGQVRVANPYENQDLNNLGMVAEENAKYGEV